MKTLHHRVNKIIWNQLIGYPHFELTGLKSSDDIKECHRLTNDLGADSLDKVEILMNMEDEFDISIDDIHSQGWITVGDIYQYMEMNSMAIGFKGKRCDSITPDL